MAIHKGFLEVIVSIFSFYDGGPQKKIGPRWKEGHRMKKHFTMVIAFILLFTLPLPTFSQTYQWRDKEGNLHFSDSPPQGVDAKKKSIVEGGQNPKPQDESSKPEIKEKRPYRDIRVILYMTDWCPYCRKARELLNSLGVNLIEYNVERDKNKGEEASRKRGGGRGVPVIDVEGIIIKGYGPDRIKAAVEKRRSVQE